MQRRHWLLLAILVGAAALRIGVDNVRLFNPADEGTYIRTTQFLLIHGWGAYPQVVRDYVADPRAWFYPDPLRYGWYAATTLGCAIQRHANAHALASVSTFASILAVFLTWLLARELLDESSALFAAALSVTSPLQLALGRRALQDEFFCARVPARALVRRARAKSPTIARSIAAALSLAFMLSVKESGLLVLPAALALIYAIKRRIAVSDVIVIVAAVALYFAGFVVVARDARLFFQVFDIVRAAQRAPYVVQFQGGPPHRVLIDLLTIAPVVFILAVAADRPPRGGRGRLAARRHPGRLLVPVEESPLHRHGRSAAAHGRVAARRPAAPLAPRFGRDRIWRSSSPSSSTATSTIPSRPR